MIITYVRRACLIAAFGGVVTLGGHWILGDTLDEFERQAQIETRKAEQLASIEVQAVATMTAQDIELRQLDIQERQLELVEMTNQATRQDQREQVSHELAIERQYQLAWLWTLVKGFGYGMIAIVPTAIGGIILWRVIKRANRSDDEHALIEVMANGAIPVSREFVLNHPAQMFEFASVRAEQEARVRLAKAEKAEYPSLTTLTHSPNATYSPAHNPTVTNDKELILLAKEMQEQGRIEDGPETTQREKDIKATYASLGVNVEVRELAKGPQVETFSIKPLHTVAKGGRLKKVTVGQVLKHENDVAMALDVKSVMMSQSAGYISCQIQRDDREFVMLADMINSEAWQAALANMHMPMALGRDTMNEDMIIDLEDQPHLFVGGATKMGKSVLVRAMIYSLCQRSPDEVKLILIDPKTVEFKPFRDIPHVERILTDMDLACQYLSSAIDEMERRNALFSNTGVQNLKEYNAKVSPDKRLAFIVIIVDEVADFIITNKDEVTEQLIRLAGKARSAGIHLILATQRPDADTIPPLVRANVMARVSVKTRTKSDSKVILDQHGAEKLMKNGDSIIDSADYQMVRFQAAYMELDDAIEAILLAHKANETGFQQVGNQAETERKQSGNKPETKVLVSDKEEQPETEESRAKMIVALHREGLSKSDIQIEIWGSKGGRKNKERNEEINRAIASVRFNGELNGYHAH